MDIISTHAEKFSVEYDKETDVLYISLDRKMEVADRYPCGLEIVWGLDSQSNIIGVTILFFKEIAKENLVKNYLRIYREKLIGLIRNHDEGKTYTKKIINNLFSSEKEVKKWLDNNITPQSKIIEGVRQNIFLENNEIKNIWRIPITPELALEITLPRVVNDTLICQLISDTDSKKQINCTKCIKIVPIGTPLTYQMYRERDTIRLLQRFSNIMAELTKIITTSKDITSSLRVLHDILSIEDISKIYSTPLRESIMRLSIRIKTKVADGCISLKDARYYLALLRSISNIRSEKIKGVPQTLHEVLWYTLLFSRRKTRSAKNP